MAISNSDIRKYKIEIGLLALVIFSLFLAIDINETLIRIGKENRNPTSEEQKKNIRKGIKRANYLYRNNIIKFNQYFSSIECFKNNYIFVNKDKVKRFNDRYNG